MAGTGQAQLQHRRIGEQQEAVAIGDVGGFGRRHLAAGEVQFEQVTAGQRHAMRIGEEIERVPGSREVLGAPEQPIGVGMDEQRAASMNQRARPRVGDCAHIVELVEEAARRIEAGRIEKAHRLVDMVEQEGAGTEVGIVGHGRVFQKPSRASRPPSAT